MRLLLLLLFFISYFLPSQKEPDLRGTWVLVKHSINNQMGKLSTSTYSQTSPSLFLYLIRKDSLVIMCGNGRPASFAGHFTLDQNNNVKLKSLGNDRLMMLPIAIEFTRRASEIHKLSVDNDTLKFFLKYNNEDFSFVRIDTLDHGLDRCDKILTNSYR
jgi:hypothetical protein